MSKYVVNGRINSRYILEKKFETNDQALKYVDQLCSQHDLQVEEVINDKYENTFIIDYYNQFSIKQLNA